VASVCWLAVFGEYALAQPTPDERIKAQHWSRSVVSSGGRVVRLAVITGSGDRVAPFAYVRRTPRTVRIKLIVRVPTGHRPASAKLFCVRVRLRFSATRRVRVDASTGRAPDRARPVSADASDRPETYALDLRGSCMKVRPRYLPSWDQRR
jgi:hypothetical protein